MNLFAMNPTITKNLLADTVTHVPAAILIRPVQPDDVDLILAMHQRLSADSIYKRYHSPRVPTRQEINQICRLDGRNGRALVATIPGRRLTIVGMAYYIVTGQESAEAAFLIEDRYQGHGIGKRLVKQLREQAMNQGIRFFDAYVMASNHAMIHLLRQTGKFVHNIIDFQAREIRVQLMDETLFARRGDGLGAIGHV